MLQAGVGQLKAELEPLVEGVKAVPLNGTVPEIVRPEFGIGFYDQGMIEIIDYKWDLHGWTSNSNCCVG